MSVACDFLASKLASMPWLLPSIIVKYMDIISRVLAQHTMGNLIVTDRPCLLGHRMKKGEDSTVCKYRLVANYYGTLCEEKRGQYLHIDS